MNQQEIETACSTLEKDWSDRKSKVNEWYKILQLVDELAQSGMESFVSNNPRTFWNLAVHLMASGIIHHRFPPEDLEPEQLDDSVKATKFLDKQWDDLDQMNRARGRQSWLRELIASMLAYGWYSVFALVDDDKCYAEIWHPLEVFPEFGDTELLQCVHKYPLSTRAANRKAKLKGWKLAHSITSNTTLKDYWCVDDDGDIANAIILGNELVKPLQKHQEFNSFGIPILVSPLAGLPDRGTITNQWKRQIGESILATNEPIYAATNKLYTFALQMIRDTAQPRWIEKSAETGEILRPEDVFSRGAIFRMTPNEDVGLLPVPPIPVELRTVSFDFQNMDQRGAFPWMLQGGITGETSGYLISQVAVLAQQQLEPYVSGLRFLLTQIDNFWLQQIKDRGYHPSNFKYPQGLKGAKVRVDYRISIPGDLVQRATVARMLDPNFKLSGETVSGIVFPEVKNFEVEFAKVRKDDALRHPVVTMIALVSALNEQARILTDAGLLEEAELYKQAAAIVQSQIQPPAEEAPPATKAPRQEAMPREAKGLPPVGR